MIQPEAELAVRLARAAFNRALHDGDLAAIKPLLTPGVVMVTGTDSAVIAGRAAQLAAWKREFAAPAASRNLYVRTPESVVLSSAEPLALEQGRWECTTGGVATASGIYSAKWRHAGGAWQLEAEIYLTIC